MLPEFMQNSNALNQICSTWSNKPTGNQIKIFDFGEIANEPATWHDFKNNRGFYPLPELIPISIFDINLTAIGPNMQR